jgi:transglutaminase-like putative cysteine protease
VPYSARRRDVIRSALTEYVYPEPAWDSFNELRLQPADDAHQRLVSFELRLEPDMPVTTHHDYFGTQVHHFHARAPHLELRIETESLVDTRPGPLVAPTPAGALRQLRGDEFLSASVRVPLDPDWAGLLGWAALSPDQDLVAYLDGLTTHLHGRFSYAPGATEVDTPLTDFVAAGRGVCQDYAHAMLGVCRQQGVPARYVSGYVYAGANYVGAEATHAWVEAWLPAPDDRPGLWLGLDPTNDCRIGESHVKIGHGRDFSDVSPVRGLRRGGGRERLDVSVTFAAEDVQEH